MIKNKVIVNKYRMKVPESTPVAKKKLKVPWADHRPPISETWL